MRKWRWTTISDVNYTTRSGTQYKVKIMFFLKKKVNMKNTYHCCSNTEEKLNAPIMTFFSIWNLGLTMFLAFHLETIFKIYKKLNPFFSEFHSEISNIGLLEFFQPTSRGCFAGKNIYGGLNCVIMMLITWVLIIEPVVCWK